MDSGQQRDAQAALLADCPTVTCERTAAASGLAPAAKSFPRFVPGAMVAGRYRIVAQVGRGGMGEVYRADDLHLGETVALKFLPESLTRDEAALERLRREVRVARQVANPHVCRVFDVGDAAGVPFISMEFVDGEDMESLLRRVGSLQTAKALQVAHQLCSGLGAIHDFGIVHRDLKPANIMLDGRGNVRITDFGLAVAVDEVPESESTAGTPAFMAPEQLGGQKPTSASDIYSVGLLLFEVFTGRRPFPNLRARLEVGHHVTAVGRDIDPTVERVILQCLAIEPAQRPPSVRAIDAALPGSDAVAVAIAAGETPSPDMIAAVADDAVISVRGAALLLAFFVVAIVLACMLARYASLHEITAPEKTPEAAADRARDIIALAGYTQEPVGRAFWYQADADYLLYQSRASDSPARRASAYTAFPGPWQFVYRQSPLPLAPLAVPSPVLSNDPPHEVSGMVAVVLSGHGKLLTFSAVPPQYEDSVPAAQPFEWRPLFEAAGLPPDSFARVSPKWQPSMAFDQQAAWDGDYAGNRFHVTAASFRGRLVHFAVTGPWSRPAREPQRPRLSARIAGWVTAAFFIGVWVLGIKLARRNWRLGRGDRKGALRLGLFIFVCCALADLLRTQHVGDPMRELLAFATITGIAFHFALFSYVLYLAFEPLVRRRWPHILVSWTRLLTGRISDARVGRDVLIGGVLGLVYLLLTYVVRAGSSLMGIREVLPLTFSTGFREWGPFLGRIALDAVEPVSWTLAALVLLLSLTTALGRRWAAMLVTGMLLALTVSAAGAGWFGIVLQVAWPTLLLVAMFRYGVLSAVVMFFVAAVVRDAPLTLHASAWFFPRAAVAVCVATAVVFYGFHAALGHRALFAARNDE